MSVFPGDFDRPLGLGKRERHFAPRDSATLLAVLAVFGASGAIALRDRPWHAPAPAAIMVAPAEALPSKPFVEPQPGTAAKTPGGPAIIKVNPPSGSIDKMAVISDPAVMPKSTVASHLPDPALVEPHAAGALPVRSADGRRPFDVYARPSSGNTRGARIALVIGGLGVSQTGTQEALAKLPPAVTLAFASGGNSLSRWMQEARRDNREILLQLPLEPFDYPQVDPGRNTLTVDAEQAANIERLHALLARFTNYVGVMNYMGARFTGERQAMAPVMDEIGRRGLMYLDDGTSGRSLAGEMAPAALAPYARADNTIDAARDRSAILKQLEQLEQTAQARGFAVGVGSAFDVTLDTVAAWAEAAAKRGIELVPVSALAADPESR